MKKVETPENRNQNDTHSDHTNDDDKGKTKQTEKRQEKTITATRMKITKLNQHCNNKQVRSFVVIINR